METSARDHQGAGQGAGPAGGRWGRRRAAAGSLLSASPASGPASVFRCIDTRSVAGSIDTRSRDTLPCRHLLLPLGSAVLEPGLNLNLG